MNLRTEHYTHNCCICDIFPGQRDLETDVWHGGQGHGNGGVEVKGLRNLNSS